MMNVCLTHGQTPSRRIGLIAGIGEYPILFAKLLQGTNTEVCCIAIRDQANPEIERYCKVVHWVGLGQFGRGLHILRSLDIREATMAGGINKKLLFQKGFLRRHFPDLYTLRLFAGHFLFHRKEHSNDSLLLTCVHAIERKGVHVVPATDFMPEIIVHRSVLTKRKPSSREWKDIVYGWKIARQMAGLDIGQSVVIKNQSVVSIEALEGTDACIKRAGALCPAGDFTIIKIAKPDQDMRFDLPFFGLETIKSVADAGGSTLAMEAEKTIFINREEVVRYANERNICIIILSHEDARQPEQPAFT